MTQEQIQQAVTLMLRVGHAFPHHVLTPDEKGTGLTGTIRLENGKVYQIAVTELENVTALPPVTER